MGKIRLQTEPCEGESEERPTLAPFVSLGHASKAGMIPVGCVAATSQAGEKRSDSDVMTDAATAPTHDERTPEEVELFERARRCEEANLLDVWGGRAPPARSIKAPGLFTATSLPPEKASPPQKRQMASDTSTPSAHNDHDSVVGNARGSSRSSLQRAAAVQGSTRPADGGMTRTASGASSGTLRVPSACAAQPPSHGVEKLASWSCPGPGRGTSDACRGGRMLRQRIGSSSARSRGKSAVNRKECAGIACEECSALRRELDFLKHVITTRSLPSESSPGTTGAGVLIGADMGLPPTGHSPSSSSRMSPLETRVHIIPSNPSQQTHLPSPTFVPRPPPCGHPSSSSEGSCSSNARPSTSFNSRGHSACTKTSWVAPIFLENGQGRRAESRNSMIARQRRASNPSSADELADEQVHFSRTGSLDGGISSAPRPCAPRRVALSPDSFFTLFFKFQIRGMPLLLFQPVSFLPSLPSSSCQGFPPLNKWRALSQHFEASR